MRQFIPFETLFERINTINPDSIANWSLEDGIRLYKGSDYSDLYHEAWHGFTQTFLTKEDKAALYKEVGKLLGNFRDFQGNTVSFSSATTKQLDEFMAEDFRTWMLNPSGHKNRS